MLGLLDYRIIAFDFVKFLNPCLYCEVSVSVLNPKVGNVLRFVLLSMEIYHMIFIKCSKCMIL